MVTAKKHSKRVNIQRPRIRGPYQCPSCQQKNNAPRISYVRVTNLRVPVRASYVHLEKAHMLAQVSQEHIRFLEMLLDYDRLVHWATTTRTSVVGIGQSVIHHPIVRYLHEAYQCHLERTADFHLYASVCEAFKGMHNLSHTKHMSMCLNATLLPEGSVSLTIYCPLPTWMNRLMMSIANIPNGGRITQEMFLTMLRSKR